LNVLVNGSRPTRRHRIDSSCGGLVNGDSAEGSIHA